MSAAKVSIVDYGLGNLFSVQRALQTVGAEVEFVSTAEGLAAAQRLVLPGVGAFADGMTGLAAQNLIGPLCGYAATRRPLLGICLGMQMLMELSHEFGEHRGLGLIPGEVRAMPRLDEDGGRSKVPHIGWNRLLMPGESQSTWLRTPLAGLAPGASAYFVHSFSVHPTKRADMLAECDYNGHRFAAVVMRDNIMGCQFHPEKSGSVGLDVLKRWVTG